MKMFITYDGAIQMLPERRCIAALCPNLLGLGAVNTAFTRNEAIVVLSNAREIYIADELPYAPYGFTQGICAVRGLDDGRENVIIIQADVEKIAKILGSDSPVKEMGVEG